MNRRFPNPWEHGFRGGRNFNRGGGHGAPPWHNRHDDGHFSRRGGVNKRFPNKHGPKHFNQQWKKKPRDFPGKRLSEVDIGVTEYVSDHKGFNGVIKNRYSDFQVSEINMNGEVAKLTDLTAPESAKEEIDEDEDLLLSKYNLELLPMETWDRINKLAVCSERTAEVVEVDVTGMTKEHRTKIHDAVKKAFGEAIVGSTVSTEDKKFVKFEKFRTGVRIDTRVKWTWPGDYVHFIVYKENCDSIEAASHITERLKMNKIKSSLLGYAGTKDRRAKTTQWFSLRKIEPERIAKACRDLREIKAGNFKFSDTHLKLGSLKGNKFRIALRNVTAEDELVDLACEELKQKGFINYYGLQRFGTRAETPTYEIGLKLLQGNFTDALHSILEEREGPLQAALSKYKETGNAELACRFLKKYSISTTVEGRLLKALSVAPNDLLGALNKMARNTRLLYLHSYQSLIWNRCVSERLRRFGHKPAEGDLVLDNTTTTDSVIEEYAEEESEEEAEESDKVDEEDKLADVNSAETSNVEVEAEAEEMKPVLKENEDIKPRVPVRVLTREDIESGKYTLLDVILPLPGFNVEYPTNIKDFYECLLKADNLTLDMRHKIKSYSLCGAYRHVIVRPSDMRWSCVRYGNPYGDLLLSDLDEINNRKLDTILPDGKYKALLLTMCLPPSCYATMALRELLRVDTSGDYQASQNNYHKTENKQDGENETESGVRKNGDVEKRKLESNVDDVDAKKVKEDENVDE